MQDEKRLKPDPEVDAAPEAAMQPAATGAAAAAEQPTADEPLLKADPGADADKADMQVEAVAAAEQETDGAAVAQQPGDAEAKPEQNGHGGPVADAAQYWAKLEGLQQPSEAAAAVRPCVSSWLALKV